MKASTKNSALWVRASSALRHSEHTPLSTPPPFNPLEEEYYGNFKALVRERMPDGKGLLVELKAAYDRFFADEQIVLSRKERYRLFLLIVQEVMHEIAEETKQLKP